MKKSTFFAFSVVVLVVALCSSVFGGVAGVVLLSSTDLLDGVRDTVAELPTNRTEVSIVDEDSAIIDVAQNSSDSVVSIIISRELTNLERRLLNMGSTEEETLQQVGSGSGFVISEDGLILTNKHVVEEEDSTYTVVFNDGKTVEAEVLGRDPLLDIAVLKIDASELNLTALPLGDSDSIKVGQTVIAIGNSLGRFSNTVSSGIISGLARTIVATDSTGMNAEQLSGVLQTDASINSGNSGGPLLDVAGNVIGVNVAVAQDAENIGFSIPINLVIPAIESIQEFGEIRRPLLGVRYQTVTPTLAEEEGLPVDYGALILNGDDDEAAIVEGSAAAEAGLQSGDIIVSINDISLDGATSLQTEIQKLSIDDVVKIGYYREGQLQSTSATLQALEE